MELSLGELVDRLSVVNNKLWHVQERVYQAARSDAGLGAQDVKALTGLNLERTSLINAINEKMNDGAPIVKITE